MATRPDWSVESWRTDEQSTRARQAPAGLTTNMHASLLLPSLSLHRPSFSLLPESTLLPALSPSEEHVLWDQVKNLLKDTHPISTDAFVHAATLLAVPEDPSRKTLLAPLTPLAQRSLDFCSSGMRIPKNVTARPNGYTTAQTFLSSMDESILMPLEAQMEAQMQAMENDVQASTTRPVTPVSKKSKSHLGVVVAPPPTVPSSLPRRRNSTSIISTPAVEVDGAGGDSEGYDQSSGSSGAWKS
ncbi:UNVERIFIED_CONTAM: hypothetical protein HDU68_011887 [Siphonaria sp. JEL0065]|nr:hypothetical protein HDU68_011887 [Siphonaria sp. JEL0065]